MVSPKAVAKKAVAKKRVRGPCTARVRTRARESTLDIGSVYQPIIMSVYLPPLISFLIKGAETYQKSF